MQEGWGKRNSDWQFSAGVQHELLPRVSVDVSYSRRWWGNFFVTHNRALGPADFDELTLTAPVDSRLPDGGGYPVTFLTRNNNTPTLGVTDPFSCGCPFPIARTLKMQSADLLRLRRIRPVSIGTASWKRLRPRPSTPACGGRRS